MTASAAAVPRRSICILQLQNGAVLRLTISAKAAAALEFASGQQRKMTGSSGLKLLGFICTKCFVESFCEGTAHVEWQGPPPQVATNARAGLGSTDMLR